MSIEFKEHTYKYIIFVIGFYLVEIKGKKSIDNKPRHAVITD